MDKVKKQFGFVDVLLLAVLLVIASAGVVGWKVYRSKAMPPNKSISASHKGVVSINDCIKAGKGCFEQSIKTDDNKMFGLVGKSVASYDGQKVLVEGQIRGTPPIQAITVESIRPVTSEASVAKGILRGQVYCTVKIDPVPCATTINLESRVARGFKNVVQTDVNGSYSVNLDPADYDVIPEPKPGYPMFVPPFTNPASIRAGHVTVVDIYYHDGTK
jgi:hypothetical protein